MIFKNYLILLSMKLSKLFLVSLLCCSSAGIVMAKSPKVVFFLVEDLGWGDLGGYLSKDHETPHLDFTDVEIEFVAK